MRGSEGPNPAPDLGRRAALSLGAAGVAGFFIGDAEADPAPPTTAARIRAALAAMPRAGLWSAPTAFSPAPRLAAHLGLGAGLWLARDDLGGTHFGGGKARKLDLLLGDARARSATSVATTGGTGSNHARSTAWAAQALGFGCRLALLPEPATPEVERNLAALKAAGAQLTLGGRDGVRRLEADAKASGGSLAWIPMGGTTPLADVAFVSAAFELADQVAAGALPTPATVVLALGSGGSAAGLALGLAFAGLPTRVVAVRCSSPGTSAKAKVAAELDGAAALLARLTPGLQAGGAQASAFGSALAEAHARLHIEDRFLGRGYALSTPEGTRAAELLADREGVHLDPTYSAKAAAALVADAARFGAGPTVLWLGCDARWLAGG